MKKFFLGVNSLWHGVNYIIVRKKTAREHNVPRGIYFIRKSSYSTDLLVLFDFYEKINLLLSDENC
jgi:hypothetical protein